MTLIAERPHIKYGCANLIRRDVKEKSVSVWDQDNVELISIEIPGVVVQSVYNLLNEKFVLPALGHGNILYIVIGDFNSHNTTQTTMEKGLNSGQIHATTYRSTIRNYLKSFNVVILMFS